MQTLESLYLDWKTCIGYEAARTRIESRFSGGIYFSVRYLRKSFRNFLLPLEALRIYRKMTKAKLTFLESESTSSKLVFVEETAYPSISIIFFIFLCFHLETGFSLENKFSKYTKIIKFISSPKPSSDTIYAMLKISSKYFGPQLVRYLNNFCSSISSFFCLFLNPK